MAAPAPTLWIVDDSPLEAEMVRRALAEGNDVEVFHDGASVLERLASGGAPDVLVLDWQMPNLSGIEMCRFLRARPATQALPILMLTANQDTEDVVAGLAAGADDYVRKPYEDAELIARVRALVRSKRLIERVEEAERSVRSLLMELPDAVIAVSDGVVVFANEEATRTWEGRALIGVPVAELLPGVDVAALAAAQKDVEPRDVKVGDRAYSPNCRQLSSKSNEITLSLHDVTEKRRADARRLDFDSIIAHDLRNPLNGMMLRTGLLLRGRRGVLSGEVNDDLLRIQGGINGLVELIDDFLDLARMDATQMRIDRTDADLCELIEASIELSRPFADSKEVIIKFEPARPIARLAIDPRRIHQVIANLLSNAIKFSRPGGVVRVVVRELAEATEVAVSDEGAGIAAVAVPTLFQRYVRAHPAGGAPPGTGLGLMIVRELVEAHGGTVCVTSELGVGSTFTVRLPRGAACT